MNTVVNETYKYCEVKEYSFKDIVGLVWISTLVILFFTGLGSISVRILAKKKVRAIKAE